MKSYKQVVLDMYFLKLLRPVDISKKLNISKSAVSQILKKDNRFIEEKNRRKNENYKKHIRNTEECNRKKRKINQLNNNIDDLILRNMHNQASLELSGVKRLNNMAYRNWNKSAYTYNEKRKRYEFRKELGKSYDVPKFIKMEI